jgi:hypothetical protein
MAAQVVVTDIEIDAVVDTIAEVAEVYGAHGLYLRDALMEVMAEKILPYLGIAVEYPEDAASLA